MLKYILDQCTALKACGTEDSEKFAHFSSDGMKVAEEISCKCNTLECHFQGIYTSHCSAGFCLDIRFLWNNTVWTRGEVPRWFRAVANYATANRIILYPLDFDR